MSGKNARQSRQRRLDMTTLEIRRGVGAPWQRLRDIAPDLVAQILPSSDGLRDERLLLVWGLDSGDLVFTAAINPLCPVALRLGGQYRHVGGWEVTPQGILRILGLLVWDDEDTLDANDQPA